MSILGLASILLDRAPGEKPHPPGSFFSGGGEEEPPSRDPFEREVSPEIPSFRTSTEGIEGPFIEADESKPEGMDARGTDRTHMARALELARRGKGKTAPNPAVGCVVVKHGEVVGEGYHPQAGKPHAEVYALRAAGRKAEGATAYVSLEPCAHFGKTPPCAYALRDARVSRVVVGFVDPNPLVEGKGVNLLKQAGVLVDLIDAELMRECREINEDFFQRIASESKG